MLISSYDAEGHDSGKRKILLIYLMISLGVAYHFENEIEKTLAGAFENLDDMIAYEHDLYTISIFFWVFRTYGYNMSAGKLFILILNLIHLTCSFLVQATCTKRFYNL